MSKIEPANGPARAKQRATITMTLPKVASYRIDAPRNLFRLVLTRGSVVEFAYPGSPARSAIVNAAITGCLGGGRVDGAIGAAGGPSLRRAR